MTTLLKLAQLSQAIYQEEPAPDDWTAGKMSLGRYDFCGGVYTGNVAENGLTVVVFRGTTASAGDISADLKLGVGMNTSHFGQAMDFMEQYAPGPDVVVCGHSLGGAMAQVVANRRKLKFATFNAPGVAIVASRNLDELAMTVATKTAFVRGAFSVVSATLHPVQAFQDVRATFNKARGVNLCLNADLVSQIGVHYGKVVRISGTGISPISQHRISTVIEVLRTNQVGSITIDSYL